MSEALDRDELRAMVRAVLRDVLPGTTASHGAATEEVVALRTDADLDGFVRRLLALFENPAKRADIAAGRLRFRLAPGAEPVGPAAAMRVERGAVTERRVKEAADAGARLVLGRAAVLTPLARDRARALGVIVEKER